MRIGDFGLAEPIPELREPHAIAMLHPWVDVGRVGTLTLRRLEAHLGVQELGRLARPGDFFDFTRYRPTVRRVEGRRQVTLPNTTVTYARREGGPDLLFLHLLEPHALAEEYIESVLAVLQRMGARRYFLVGAMYDAVPHTRPLMVTGSVGEGRWRWIGGRIRAREHGEYKGLTSIAYLLYQEGARLGIETGRALVHLPQYAPLEEDYAGVARLLELLCALYRLPSELVEAERGQRQYQALSVAVARRPELNTLIQQLEAQYDAQAAGGDQGGEPPLPPEVVGFLQELGHPLGGP